MTTRLRDLSDSLKEKVTYVDCLIYMDDLGLFHTVPLLEEAKKEFDKTQREIDVLLVCILVEQKSKSQNRGNKAHT